MESNINNIAATTTTSDDETTIVIYHMCPKILWEAANNNKETTTSFYFPRTFEQDGGFVHATQHAHQLLYVANHFYSNTSSTEEWICLEIRPLVLEQEYGIHTKWEAAAPVGKTQPDFNTDNNDPRRTFSSNDPPSIHSANKNNNAITTFPHIYGGIPTTSKNVIANIYPMIRNPSDGTFLSISGLYEP